MAKSISFEDSLEDSDYGLIVDGTTGQLKGIWVPDERESEPLPITIVSVMVNCFGVSPTESETIH